MRLQARVTSGFWEHGRAGTTVPNMQCWLEVPNGEACWGSGCPSCSLHGERPDGACSAFQLQGSLAPECQPSSSSGSPGVGSIPKKWLLGLRAVQREAEAEDLLGFAPGRGGGLVLAGQQPGHPEPPGSGQLIEA